MLLPFRRPTRFGAPRLAARACIPRRRGARPTASPALGASAVRLVLAAALVLGLAPESQGQAASARIKELVVPAGAAPVQLLGYGIVVGLDRTGDRARGRSGAPYTVQSIANMLQRFGVAVDPAMLGSRNAAAVMVTARLDPFAGPGSALDVTVSALGDARSLSGGVLLQTPLQNMASPDADIHAMAQGPVLTGTLLASAAGSSRRTGPTNTGRVPSGATVVLASGAELGEGPLDLVLREPDFTNAAAIAEAVNASGGSATAVHAGLVRVETAGAGPAATMAALEGVRVGIDVPARIVVNERTGTIVAGGEVRIAEVMVTSGGLTISTAVDPLVSQPNALAGGRTVQARVGSADIDAEPVRSVVLQPNTNVAELAAALNDLGLSSREVIAVFQAIDRAGALQGELVVL